MTQNRNLPKICQSALSEAFDTDLFKALCDPTRIFIIATLAARSDAATVSDVAECCGIDFSGVSRHLKILLDAGIVSAEKSGRAVLYSLDAADLAGVLRGAAEALEFCQSNAASVN